LDGGRALRRSVAISLAVLGGLLLVGLVLWLAIPRVPGVAHLKPDAAAQRLMSSRLRLGKVSVGPYSSAPRAGQITALSPAAGQFALALSPVDVTVYEAPDTVVVPSVVGCFVEDATGTIEKAGLRPKTSGGTWVVTSQRPAAGSTVRYGSTVGIEAMAWVHSTKGTDSKGFWAVHGALVLRYGLERSMADCLGQCHTAADLCARPGCHSASVFRVLLPRGRIQSQ
jgi:hypothetical protein